MVGIAIVPASENIVFVKLSPLLVELPVRFDKPNMEPLGACNISARSPSHV